MRKSDKGKTPDHLKDAVMQSDPIERMIHATLSQNGLLPNLTQQNPELMHRLISFFTGEKRIMIVAGESGMGKSLMGADIRALHTDLSLVLDKEQTHPLAIITWDRAHKNFFNVAEIDLGVPLKLPPGETHVDARIKISQAIGVTAQFVFNNMPDTLLLIEAPLFDHRGEHLYQQLPPTIISQSQLLIMHSPVSRYESLKGRDLETSGQPPAMVSMRESLKRIAGIKERHLSQEAEDEAIKLWWQQVLQPIDGMIVEWDPEKDRKRFNETRLNFRKNGIGPDLITPRLVSQYLSSQMTFVLRTIPDIDMFLQLISIF